MNVPLSLDGSDQRTEREALERLPQGGLPSPFVPRGARCKKLDVLIETPDLIVVIDHKSFPGRATDWPDQVRKHAGQSHLHGEAITASPPPKRVLLALHLPISGGVLVVE